MKLTLTSNDDTVLGVYKIGDNENDEISLLHCHKWLQDFQRISLINAGLDLLAEDIAKLNN